MSWTYQVLFCLYHRHVPQLDGWVAWSLQGGVVSEAGTPLDQAAPSLHSQSLLPPDATYHCNILKSHNQIVILNEKQKAFFMFKYNLYLTLIKHVANQGLTFHPRKNLHISVLVAKRQVSTVSVNFSNMLCGALGTRSWQTISISPSAATMTNQVGLHLTWISDRHHARPDNKHS